MHVIQLVDSALGPVLSEADVPQPQPGAGEVLIRVCAAGVTAAELDWYPTRHTKSGEVRSRAIPGHEFSGVIAAIGDESGGFRVGQEVFGMNDWFADGAMAEYCVAPITSIAPKPSRITHIEAASVPIAALTSWQGLFDRAGLKAGEHLLVQGGAGGVGVFAIQLAKLHGARVTATASARNVDFVASLGADRVIDYTREPFEKSLEEVDVVFDTVGGETLDRSWRVLKPHGRMVTIAATEEAARDGRVKDVFFIVEPNQKQLIEIGEMIADGRLRTVIDTVVPLAQAPRAFAGIVARQGRGKVVVEITS